MNKRKFLIFQKKNYQFKDTSYSNYNYLSIFNIKVRCYLHSKKMVKNDEIYVILAFLIL